MPRPSAPSALAARASSDCTRLSAKVDTASAPCECKETRTPRTNIASVTAVASGTVVIQATNDGAAGIITANVVLSSTDTDGDGIPDDVEITLGLDPRNPVDAQEDFDRDGLTNLQEYQLGTGIRNADSDGDGFTNAQEYFAGTNPNDSQSKFLIQSVTPQPGGFQITWPSQPSIIYRVQWKNNLTDPMWQSIAPDFTGTGSVMNWLDDGTKT